MQYIWLIKRLWCIEFFSEINNILDVIESYTQKYLYCGSIWNTQIQFEMSFNYEFK